jgi:hypothetical protein
MKEKKKITKTDVNTQSNRLKSCPKRKWLCDHMFGGRDNGYGPEILEGGMEELGLELDLGGWRAIVVAEQ